MAIRIVLAEDHAFTLSGMQHALATDPAFQVVAAVTSGIKAIAMARMHDADVALVDHGLPGASGLEVFAELRRWSPRTRTMIVTGNANPATLAELDHAGLPGLLSKTTPMPEVLRAIIRVAQGETVRCKVIMDLIAPLSADTAGISMREHEVLTGISEGLTNSGIARKLSISPKTVESHRASLMRKLEVNSTASLLVQAVRRGILEI